MTERHGPLAWFAGLCRTAYEHHYLPYLRFLYGGEHLHHGDEPAARGVDLPYRSRPEPREKAP
jgi:hypothetical protein